MAVASDEDLGGNPPEAMGSLREEVDEMLMVQVFGGYCFPVCVSRGFSFMHGCVGADLFSPPFAFTVCKRSLRGRNSVPIIL